MSHVSRQHSAAVSQPSPLNLPSALQFLSSLVLALAALLPAPAVAQDRAQQAATVRQQMYEAAQAIVAPELVGRNLAHDLESLESAKQLREFVTLIEKEYATEIREGNQPYRDVESTIRYSRERIEQFQKALAQYASLQEFNADAEHIRRMLKLAVENQAPAYFNDGNDISNRRLSIANKLRVMKELESDDLKKATEIAKAIEAEIVQEQAKLSTEIIAGNQLPVDQYANPDREELLKLVESAWLKAVPTKKPLRTGLIGDNWSRTEKWEVQNRTLYKVERSQIQGFVLVAHDPETVVCYHVQIRRDHIDNDRTTAWLMDDPSQAPEPRQLILTSNVQP